MGTTSWVLSGNISSFCKVAQRVYWPGDGGASITSDKTDWHGVAAANQFTPPCLTQTHARFWDDHEHARITSGHGRLDQWVIGGIHHEHPVAKRTCTKVAGQRVCVAYGSTHKIDRDWDAVNVPDIEEHLYRGRVAAWTFRLRVPLLILYAVVVGAAFWGGTTEDSDLAIMSVPGFAFGYLVGYLSPVVGPLLPLVALAGAIVAGNKLDGGFQNEASGINLIGGLLIAEFCIAMGVLDRRRRQRAIETWRTQQRLR